MDNKINDIIYCDIKTIKKNRIEKLIYKKISLIFIKDPLYKNNFFINVNKVCVVNEMEIAKIYLSFFPFEMRLKLFNIFCYNSKYYKRKLYLSLIKNNLKKIPKFNFYIYNK